METSIFTEDEKTVVAITGRLDTISSPEFDKAIAALPDNTGDIIIDCSGMEYISSAGLRSFISLLKSRKAAGKQLTLKSLPSSIKSIFDMTGFTSLFSII